MQRYSTNVPAAASELFDGELVVAHYGSGLYYSLSASGTLIWQGLRHGLACTEVAEWLSAHFPERRHDMDGIVAAFVDKLREEGLLIPVTEVAGDAPLPDLNGAAFETPKLDRFDDLQDLLLADPVHDVDSTGWPRRASESTS